MKGRFRDLAASASSAPPNRCCFSSSAAAAVVVVVSSAQRSCRWSWLSLLSFSFLLLLGSVPSADARLVFQPFDAECSDGTPAGIYVPEDFTQSDPHRHVVVFIGGGACTSPDDCEGFFPEEPFKYSTFYNPKTLRGDTVLSDNPFLNVMHNYTKWLVPYCSQDFFLGDSKKGRIGNFTHQGSDIFRKAIKAWKYFTLLGGVPFLEGDEAFQQQQLASQISNPALDRMTPPRLDNFVVVGLSAGAVAVLNHVDVIRFEIGNRVRNFRVLLDSPTLSDQPSNEKDWMFFVRNYVDLEQYPMCDPTSPVAVIYAQQSALPCCLSTHCMLRHDERLQSFYLPVSDVGVNAELLILDSLYDTFAMVVGTSFEPSPGIKKDEDEEDTTGRQQLSEGWQVGEMAGARRQKSLDTATITIYNTFLRTGSYTVTPRVRWITSSCVTHTYLVPAREFLFLSCDHGNYEDQDFEIVCSEEGFAVQRVIEQVLKISTWRTTETWNQCEFEGLSIRQIVNNFVKEPDRQDDNVFALDRPAAIDHRFENCSGPNCLDVRYEDHDIPSCQALIEIHGELGGLDFKVESVVSGFFLVFFVMSVLIRARARRRVFQYMKGLTAMTSGQQTSISFGQGAKSNEAASSGKNMLVRNIHVVSRDNSTVLLRNVSLDLKHGTLAALCGRSGSGKSTLLRALSQLKHPDIKVSMNKHDEAALATRGKTYLRQEDHLGYDGLTPAEYLILSARIYNSDDKTLHHLLSLTNNLLQSHNVSEGEEDNKYSWKPVFEKTIRNLSGGQRRILMIVASLLLNQSLLLLDEPLTGLDSASSANVIESLRQIADSERVIIIVIVHQPSRELMKLFDKLLIMQAGSIVLNRKIRTGPDADQAVSLLSDALTTQQKFKVASTDRPTEIYEEEKKDSDSASMISDLAPEPPPISNFFRGLLPIKESDRSDRDSSKNSNDRGGEQQRLSRPQPPQPSQPLPPPQPPIRNGTRSQESQSQTTTNQSSQSRTPLTHPESGSTDPQPTQGLISRDPPLPQVQTSNHDSNTISSTGDHYFSSADSVSKHSTNFTVAEEAALTTAQFSPLLRRLQLHAGWEFSDVIVMFMSYAVGAYIISFETVEVLKTVLVTFGTIAGPGVLLLHKVLLVRNLWLEHRNELDDRRVSITAYQLATNSIMFPVPMLAVTLANLVLFLILRFSLQTYTVHNLFSILHMLFVFQVGKALGVVLGSKGTAVVRAMTIYLFLSYAFSSTWQASWKFPPAIRWLVAVSMSFWAVGGSITNYFNEENWDNSEECNDYVSCVLTDGTYLAHVLGYAPLATPNTSAVVLCIGFGMAFLAENVALRLRRR